MVNGGTQQPWVFLLKMIILGCEMGIPPFKETPIYQLANHQLVSSPQSQRDTTRS